MSKDYYNTLGLSKNATQEEIKKAFRKKAHEYHPDKKTGNEAKFKEANEAYQTLGNESKRKQYDQFGSTFDQAGFGGGGFSAENGSARGWNWQDFARQTGARQDGFRTNINFQDFDLGDIFSDFFGQGRGQKQAAASFGADLEYRMEIELEESAFGAEKNIGIEKLDKCDNCGGKGYDSKAKIITCPQCHGQGRITQTQRTILGSFQTQSICPTCRGEGKKPDKFCSECHGQGISKQVKQLKVKIPAGINSGESIKLSGEGEAGEKGGHSGDLYITFTIRPHRQFARHGYDILSKQEINIVQAALGGKIEISTVDGQYRLKVPAGTEFGKVFKLSGKGSYKLHGRGRGDHLVEITIKVPKNLSRKAKKLLEELNKEI
ncbi:MAG: molecular chaperone DnaJ [Candidatus Kuenenbacteria bacterium]